MRFLHGISLYQQKSITMKNLISLLAIVCIVVTNSAQGQVIQNALNGGNGSSNELQPSCGSHDLMRVKDSHAPGYLQLQNEVLETIVTENAAEEKQQSNYTERYIIPVVFHVVHNIASENIPDSVIQDQLVILNESYRRQNANAVDTRPEFLSLVGDAQIEFVLADTDPNGNPTNGITRTQTSIEHFGGILPYNSSQTAEIEQWAADSLFPNYFRLTKTNEGGIDPWDTTRYLNVWMGDLRIFEPQINNFEEMLYFGLATPPENHPNWPVNILANLGITQQGVLLHYVNVGSNNPNTFPAPYGVYNNRTRDGKILVHEVGHFLGLRHIWGDGNCSEDDFIADTPNATNGANWACNQSSNTCTDNINGADLPDMVENYMDYSNGSCQNAFTFGQIDVMREVLEQFRPDLWTSISVVDINELAASEFNVYPNPNNGSFHIDFKQTGQNVSLHILNSMGQTVISEQHETTDQLMVNVDLAPGVYLLNIQVNGGRLETRRLIVQ